MAAAEREPDRSTVELFAVEAGRGPPLVLVHGWSFSHAAFAPQLAALSARSRVVAVDLRGHGASPAPAGGYAVEDAAADLARLFDDRGLDGAVLAGWSWGAEVALAALPLLRHRIAGLALLAATPRFCAGEGWPHGLAATTVRALSRRLARDPEGTRRLFVEGMFTEGELDPVARASLSARLLAPPVAIHAARLTLDALAAADLRPAVRLARGIPTTILHGDRDGICLPAAARALAAELEGARLTILPGVGHAPQLTRAAEVNRELALLLAAAEGRS